MQQLLRNLSTQDQKLYALILRACLAALVFGLLLGLISFNSQKKDTSDNWQPTTLAPIPDVLTEFAAISNNPRWYRENVTVNPEQAAEAARKAVEGQPESLKLIGIVERNKRPYALFIPLNPNPSNGGAPKGVAQFAVGETLVGDWVVKDITKSVVVVVANKEGSEQQTKEISLYQTKK